MSRADMDGIFREVKELLGAQKKCLFILMLRDYFQSADKS